MNPSESREDDFAIERHGEVTVITPSTALESMDSTLVEQAAAVMLDPLREDSMPLVIFDLSRVDYFGSVFLGVLLRCWRQTDGQGGSMALCGVSDRARELLRLTSLDIIWPMYDDRGKAMEALLAE
jgi:anti-anti-sigma factor